MCARFVTDVTVVPDVPVVINVLNVPVVLDVPVVLNVLDVLNVPLIPLFYTTPCAIMALATFMKPAMLAPFT